MKSIPIFVLFIIACKPLVRHVYQPTVATEISGKKKVARQLVLLTSSSDEAIKRRIELDSQLETTLNELLLTNGKRQDKIADTLHNLLSWPGKLMLWDNANTAVLRSDDKSHLEQALAEDGELATAIPVEKYAPKIIWQRSFDNDKQSTLAKLNFGALNALIYTVAPKDIPAGNDDQLFAETIVLYADDIDAILDKTEVAKQLDDKQQEEIKSGWYAIGRLLSPVKLYREALNIGKAFAFQNQSAESEYSHTMVFTSFGIFLATAIFVGDEMISIARSATGKKITRLSKWIHDRGDQISKWGVFSKAQTVERGKQHVARLGRRATRLGLAIPVVIAAHILGRVMGAKVGDPALLHK
ncbi:MAG: hypothetical protein OYH77_04545 [Pseudomonadota bacterium]|nr:hypothetical protein [Pseudomonadota bacterium]